MKAHNNKKLKFKNGFSLIELIFVIVVIGIIASFALPKLMGINEKATTSTISSDIKTIVTSIQSYYMVNKKIDKISDSVNLNSSVWNIEDKSVSYKENGKDCVQITVDGTNINLVIDESVSDSCAELVKNGIKSEIYTLN
jgi:general secretion pathway protein G